MQQAAFCRSSPNKITRSHLTLSPLLPRPLALAYCQGTRIIAPVELSSSHLAAGDRPMLRMSSRGPFRGGRSRGQLRVASSDTLGGRGSEFRSEKGRGNPIAEDVKRRATSAADALRSRAAELRATAGELAAELAEKTRRGASRFEQENDLRGKARSAFRTAGSNLEEFGGELRRRVRQLDERYSLRDRAEELKRSAARRAGEVDDRFQLKRRLAAAGRGFARDWPQNRRRLGAFLRSPFGRLFSFLFFAWLVVSGWMFQLIVWALCFVPFAPLLAQRLLKRSVVEGTCPACKSPFVGARSEVLVCPRCRGVVWQPRRDYSKDDPTIIDIEAE